jgi:hypothetical protein
MLAHGAKRHMSPKVTRAEGALTWLGAALRAIGLSAKRHFGHLFSKLRDDQAISVRAK